ncbi:hypothetical protein [Amaricoccus sp. W119]|uniref:hypothetical protein n=1 Tax=Amaricoccus sp. W119 TaxID=3391833 RepID=UPI0039A6004A
MSSPDLSDPDLSNPGLGNPGLGDPEPRRGHPARFPRPAFPRPVFPRPVFWRLAFPRLAPLLLSPLLLAAPAGWAADPGPLPRPPSSAPASSPVPAPPDPEGEATATEVVTEAATGIATEIVTEATTEASRAEADLFAMPRIAEQTRAASARIQAGDLDGAAAILDRLARDHPRIGLLEANRATLLALRGDTEAAVGALRAAAARGYDGIAALAADPIFSVIARDPRIAALAAAETLAKTQVETGTTTGAGGRTGAASPHPGTPDGTTTETTAGAQPEEFPGDTTPADRPLPRPLLGLAPLRMAPVTDGEAPVSGANTVWDPVAERLRASFAFPAQATGPVVPDRNTNATDLLREHHARGRAAGNLGDLYDNRDRGHSALDPKDAPQLARVTYSPTARAADLDYGLGDRFLFGAPTLGNSSTAITGGAFWRSLPRLAMTRADGTGPLRLWQNARANALYIYPAHKDYGPEDGDLFPANTPYLIVSHGSSGSDQPFLEAVAMIYAAYRPDTKARLVTEGLLVPMTQMVFRRSLQSVRSRADYFSAAAHPAAYEAYDINLARMVSLANSIRPGDIPPQVRIAVTAEDLGVQGLDFFGEGLSEQLFDTPAAVARIWRSRVHTREITLDAGETADPNGRDLSFEWRLLAGDPEKVRITPSEDGRSARIALDWHEPFPISEDNPVTTHRVDIGVFANNGVHDSAPAILSVHFPPGETRVYETGPDGAARIASIAPRDVAGDTEGNAAGAAGGAKPYADPMLLPRADWRDDYLYAEDGMPLGWIRTWTSGATEAFDAVGHRLGPEGPEPVSYPLRQDAEGRLLLGEAPPPAEGPAASPAEGPPTTDAAPPGTPPSAPLAAPG